jgi:hypothetical protein
MIDRRAALQLVSSLFAMQTAHVTPRGTCPLPETLTLDLGAGACAIKTIRIVQGAVSLDVSVDELLAALKG